MGAALGDALTAATPVTFVVSGPGPVWLALAPADSYTMLAPAAGAAVVGSAGAGVGAFLMEARTLAGMVPLSAASSSSSFSNASWAFDAAAGRATLRYTRALDPGTGDVDKALRASLGAPSQAFIWARGVLAEMDDAQYHSYHQGIVRVRLSDGLQLPPAAPSASPGSSGGNSSSNSSSGAGVPPAAPSCNATADCSGHGACLPAADAYAPPECSCSLGYSGSACDSCAPYFIAAADGSCAERPGSVAADITLTLNASLVGGSGGGGGGARELLRERLLAAAAAALPFAGGVGSDGSQQRAIFLAALAADVAASVGVPSSRVAASRSALLPSGALSVVLSVLPGGAAVGAAAAGSSASSVASVAADVLRLVLNASLAATRGCAFCGSLALALPEGAAAGDASAAVSLVAAPYSAASLAGGDSSAAAAPPLPPFFAPVSLGPALSMSWRIVAVSGVPVLEARLTGPADVWFGVAFNDGPGMVGGDAVLVEPGAGGVSQLALHGYTIPTCPRIAAAVSSLVPGSLSVSFSSSGGVDFSSGGGGGSNASAGGGVSSRRGALATFARTLASDPCAAVGAGACPGSDPGMRALGDAVTLTYAVGLSGHARLSTHTAAAAGSVRVSLTTGAVLAQPRPPSAGEYAALSLGALGGCALVPLALAWPHLLARDAQPVAGPWAMWLRGLRVLGATGAVLASPGFGAFAGAVAARQVWPTPAAAAATSSSAALLQAAVAEAGSAVLALLCALLAVLLVTAPRWLPLAVLWGPQPGNGSTYDSSSNALESGGASLSEGGAPSSAHSSLAGAPAGKAAAAPRKPLPPAADLDAPPSRSLRGEPALHPGDVRLDVDAPPASLGAVRSGGPGLPQEPPTPAQEPPRAAPPAFRCADIMGWALWCLLHAAAWLVALGSPCILFVGLLVTQAPVAVVASFAVCLVVGYAVVVACGYVGRGSRATVRSKGAGVTDVYEAPSL